MKWQEYNRNNKIWKTYRKHPDFFDEIHELESENVELMEAVEIFAYYVMIQLDRIFAFFYPLQTKQIV